MENISYSFTLFGIDILLTPFHFFLFLLNISLFLFSGKIVKLFTFNGDKVSHRIWTFRFFNVLFMVLHLVEIVLENVNKEYQQMVIKVAFSLISFYSFKIFLHVLSHFITRKFGDTKNIDSKEVTVESYSSRMVNILTSILLIFLNLVIVINIWGFNSLLETTGLIGIVLGFMALTSSIWAPDVFHGLVLLNSHMVEDGDIVEIDKEIFIVYKTSFMETVLLNVANNHRTRIRNGQLASMRLDNLTKLAHPQGLRLTLNYKIAYPSLRLKSIDDRKKVLTTHKELVKKMFDEAYKECCETDDVFINPNVSFEVLLQETGDFALHYFVSFYINKIKKTKFTNQARDIFRSKHRINEIIFEHSVLKGVDLSTPVLIDQKLTSS